MDINGNKKCMAISSHQKGMTHYEYDLPGECNHGIQFDGLTAQKTRLIRLDLGKV